VQHSKNLRFGDVYREELKQAKNIQVVLHANVLDFATENTQGRVSAVHARNIEGKKLTVKAKFFVLCAGGLENPRLLLLSNEQYPSGLGNQHDLVGRYFMEHIYVRDAGKLMLSELRNMKLYERRKVNGINVRTGLGLSAETLRKHQLMNAWVGLKLKGSPTSHNEYDELDYKDRVIEDKYNSLSYLTRSFKNGEVPDDLWHHVSAAMNDIGARIERKFSPKKPVQQKPSTVIEFSTHSEQAPNPDSRVYLGNEIDEFGQRKLVLDWRLMEIDHASIRNTVELMARQFGATNIGRMMSAFNERDDVWTTPQSADENDIPAGNFHHMGTTKMHDNPKEGVVDANLKVHGLHNMYIAGSSVFPTSGFANPTLSIVALTCRLADHLKSKLT
jgi:choline dehydrogenase-like flavoprotein